MIDSLCRITAQNGEFTLVENAKETRCSCYQALWTGFIYDKHGNADDAAITALLQNVNNEQQLDSLANSLRGTFFLAIRNETDQTIHCFVDDSGLFSAYRGNSAVSTSFLHLCESENIRSDSFPRLALLELLNLGNVYFGDTLSPEVRKISSDEVVVQTATSQAIVAKQIDRLWDLPHSDSIRDAMQPLAKALSGKTISVDMTGGFDSRLLACLLVSHGVEFEVGLSGEPQMADAVLGKQVADVLDLPYYFTQYDSSEIVQCMPDTLERLDGIGGTLVVSHRLQQLNESRISRGVDVSLKGSGGELYKDFFWTQDFPFYRSRTTRMSRLNRMRIEQELLAEQSLTPDAYAEYQTLRTQRVARLEQQYKRPYNTQSYDSVYLYERIQTWNSRTITSSQHAKLAIHAPLCELLVAQHGYHAPRRKRFYNLIHKNLISEISPAAAKVLTTDGTSASSRSADVLRDSLGYATVRGKKLAKKLGQLVYNKTKFVSKAYTPDKDLLQQMAQTELAKQSMAALQEAGILRRNVTLSDLSPRFQEHAIVAGWVIRRLG